MPIKKAAFKALRQSKKRELKNRKIKKDLDILIKNCRLEIKKGNQAKAQESMKKIIKSLDKAVKIKIIKKNTAARHKSRLTKRLNFLIKKPQP